MGDNWLKLLCFMLCCHQTNKSSSHFACFAGSVFSQYIRRFLQSAFASGLFTAVNIVKWWSGNTTDLIRSRCFATEIKPYTARYFETTHFSMADVELQPTSFARMVHRNQLSMSCTLNIWHGGDACHAKLALNRPTLRITAARRRKAFNI